MVGSRPSRHLVLSDLHFGIRESSLNNPLIANALDAYIHENGPWKSVILNGDLLDLNMSSFELSVEGGLSGKTAVIGLRQFLSSLVKPKSFAGTIRNWIYIPGNHDYQVWTLLSNDRIYVERLASGNRLDMGRSDLKEGIWKKGSAFISGAFPPGIRKNVTVQYPDHVIAYTGGKIVVTHGHYLDSKQMLFKRLKELVHESGDEKKAMERMYLETDRFQIMANALIYSSDLQKYMNSLLRTGRMARNIGTAIGKLMAPGKSAARFSISPLRGESINIGQLCAVEFYLKFFRNHKKAPDHFIYGHTHAPGMSSTAKIPGEKRLYTEKEILVCNTGAFIAKGDFAATFIRIEIPQTGKPEIIPVKINRDGKVHE